MAIKYTCDQCGKMFDKKEEVSEFHFFPSNDIPLFVHYFDCGSEKCKEISNIVHILCGKCASELMAHYLNRPVDTNRRNI